MKRTHVALLSLLSLGLASCGSRYNRPEELTIPVIHAIQANDADRLACLQPTEKEIMGVYEGNPEEVGYVFSNKYTKSYRTEYMKGRMINSLDIINTISKQNDLDWSHVRYSDPVRKDVNDEGKSFSIVTTTLEFPNKKQYDLQIHAVKENFKWFLMDDVYFETHQTAAK